MNIGPLIKSGIFVLLVTKYGFLYAILISFIRAFVIDLIMQYAFNLIPLKLYDYIFLQFPKGFRNTLTGLIVFKEYNPEKIKNVLVNKGLKRVHEFKKIVTSKLGSYYWQDSDKPVENQVKIIPENEASFETYEDIVKYSLIQQQNEFEIGGYLYEFHLVKFKDQLAMIAIFDHAMSDGVGFIGFLIALSDNYNLNLYPPMKNISMFEWILLYAFSPFYMLKYIYKMSKLKSFPNILKNPVFEKDPSLIFVGKKYDFTKVNNIAKHLKVSFNELLMSILSKCTNDLLKNNDEKNSITHINCNIPINLRALPKNIDNVRLSNEVMGFAVSIPLINDVKKECISVKKETHHQVRDLFLGKGMDLLNRLILTIIPNYFPIMKVLYKQYKDQVEFVFSNVPGPKSNLYYDGIEMTEIIPLPNKSFLNNFIAVLTYNGHFCLTYCSDIGVKIDHKKFLNSFEDELDKLL